MVPIEGARPKDRMSRFKHFRSSLATGVAALALVGGVAPAEASVTTITMSADGAAEAVTLTSTASATATASSTATTADSTTSTSKATSTSTAKVTSTTATKKATTTATSCTLGESTTGVTCDEAIAFMTEQMNSGSTAWHDLCLALVSQAYGSVYAGYPSACSAA